jgi:peptide/nickel transport system permease protein
VFTYILRRISIAIVILLGSTFLVYQLEANSADPLEALNTSSDPRVEQQKLALIRSLDLNTPSPLRYFKWLGGVLKIFIGQPDFGKSRDSHSVIEILGIAIPTTVRLVISATVLAIVVGITIGVITALRQYSRFDYAITFISFLFFSLPVFWIAVLLKQFLAIQANPWLLDPVIEWPFILGLSVFAGLFWGGVLGGTLKRTLTVFAVAAGATAVVLELISLTRWFANPVLGPVFILVMGATLAVLVTLGSTGLNNRPALMASGTMVLLGVVLYFPLNAFVFTKDFSNLYALGLLVLTVGAGLLAGWFFAKEDRGAVMRTSALTAVLVALLIYYDRIVQTWVPYSSSSDINGWPIPTTGEANTLLQNTLAENPDYWMSTIDSLLHLVLPTIALVLLSFAGYVRYTRGSLLEVLNMDYIRTARAKGLSERTVIMRHAFRNALIPLATLVAWDFAGIVGGAIITESVFGWYGMGNYFRQAISTFDLNLLMGVSLVTSFMVLMANLLADVVYGALDPRIRVGS